MRAHGWAWQVERECHRATGAGQARSGFARAHLRFAKHVGLRWQSERRMLLDHSASVRATADELERTLEPMRADLDPSFFEHLRWEVEQQASLHTSLTPHASRCATHFGDTHFCDTHFCDTHFCDTHFCDSPLFVTAQFCDTHFCGTHFCDSPLL